MFNKLKERNRAIKYREAINKDIWGSWKLSDIPENVMTQVDFALIWLNNNFNYYKLYIDTSITPICRIKEI